MPTVAFTDTNGGYYQTEVVEVGDVPDWAKGMAPCPVVVPVVDPKDAIRAQINALYAAAGVEEKSAWLLDSGMASMLALAATQGTTEPDLYALNPGYRQVKDASMQIAALKAQM